MTGGELRYSRDLLQHLSSSPLISVPDLDFNLFRHVRQEANAPKDKTKKKRVPKEHALKDKKTRNKVEKNENVDNNDVKEVKEEGWSMGQPTNSSGDAVLDPIQQFRLKMKKVEMEASGGGNVVAVHVKQDQALDQSTGGQAQSPNFNQNNAVSQNSSQIKFQDSTVAQPRTTNHNLKEQKSEYSFDELLTSNQFRPAFRDRPVETSRFEHLFTDKSSSSKPQDKEPKESRFEHLFSNQPSMDGGIEAQKESKFKHFFTSHSSQMDGVNGSSKESRFENLFTSHSSKIDGTSESSKESRLENLFSSRSSKIDADDRSSKESRFENLFAKTSTSAIPPSHPLNLPPQTPFQQFNDQMQCNPMHRPPMQFRPQHQVQHPQHHAPQFQFRPDSPHHMAPQFQFKPDGGGEGFRPDGGVGPGFRSDGRPGIGGEGFRPDVMQMQPQAFRGNGHHYPSRPDGRQQVQRQPDGPPVYYSDLMQNNMRVGISVFYIRPKKYHAPIGTIREG